MKRILLVLIALAVPSMAQAQTQTAAITSYVFRAYQQGATAPTQTETFLATAVQCGQAPPPVGTSVNPTKIVWTDIAAPTLACIFTDPATGALHSVPTPGNYEGTLQAVSNDPNCTTAPNCASPESARATFSRATTPLPPVAPTGVRIVR